jgi:hypothetical protein
MTGVQPQALLTVQNVIDGIRRLNRRKGEWSEVSLRLELCLGPPEDEGAERISLVDTVHQERHALVVPDEASLELRNAKLARTDLLDDLANG